MSPWSIKMSEYSLNVFIPLIPPGINQTYGLGYATNYDLIENTFIRRQRAKMFKNKEADEWADGASKIIGAKAGEIDFKPSPYMAIDIILQKCKHDADAPIKLIIDTVSKKLGFDDKIILDIHITKKPEKLYPHLEEGVDIWLSPVII
jgi:hypothetical protein